MKTTSIFTSLALIGCNSFSQVDNEVVGKKFPQIKSLSLAGKEVALPVDTKGKLTLVTIAFIEEGQPFIDSWAEPFLNTYYGRDDFAYYEVPMMNIPQPAARQFIDAGMRAGIEKKMHPNVVTYYGDFRKYRIALKMPKINSGYAYLLDKNGIIRFRGEGYMTQNDWEILKATINELMKI